VEDRLEELIDTEPEIHEFTPKRGLAERLGIGAERVARSRPAAASRACSRTRAATWMSSCGKSDVPQAGRFAPIPRRRGAFIRPIESRNVTTLVICIDRSGRSGGPPTSRCRSPAGRRSARSSPMPGLATRRTPASTVCSNRCGSPATSATSARRRSSRSCRPKATPRSARIARSPPNSTTSWTDTTPGRDRRRRLRRGRAGAPDRGVADPGRLRGPGGGSTGPRH